MPLRFRLAALICLVGSSPAMGDASLTFEPPAKATPTTVIAGNGVAIYGSTASLSSFNSWNTAMADTLTAQSFGPANGWSYGTGSPVPLANSASYKVVSYSLSLNPGNSDQVGEEIAFAQNLGTTTPPAGATSSHWLQLVHSSAPINGFGYAIAALGGGYWQVDNGQYTGLGGSTAPFYDSNAPPGTYSVPPDFYDFPSYFNASPGFYLQFWTVQSWEVPSSNGGGVEDIVVAGQALTWGITTVPEPMSLVLVVVGGVVVLVARLRTVGRRHAKVPS